MIRCILLPRGAPAGGASARCQKESFQPPLSSIASVIQIIERIQDVLEEALFRRAVDHNLILTVAHYGDNLRLVTMPHQGHTLPRELWRAPSYVSSMLFRTGALQKVRIVNHGWHSSPNFRVPPSLPLMAVGHRDRRPP
jgi:hypothetical protein